LTDNIDGQGQTLTGELGRYDGSSDFGIGNFYGQGYTIENIVVDGISLFHDFGIVQNTHFKNIKIDGSETDPLGVHLLYRGDVKSCIFEEIEIPKGKLVSVFGGSRSDYDMEIVYLRTLLRSIRQTNTLTMNGL